MIWEQLTPRETQVANLLLRGLSNKEIGADIGLAERTIKSIMYRIITKAGLRKFDGIKRVRLAVMLYEEQNGRSKS